MSNVRMARIAVGDDAWRAFRAMCLEQGVDASDRLGQLVKDAVHAYQRGKPQPRRASKGVR